MLLVGVLIFFPEIVTGMLDKTSLGNRGGSLLHIIMNDATPEDCRDFINITQRVVNHWLLHRGFSIGISDVTPSAALTARKGELVAEGYEACKDLIEQFQQGKLTPSPGCSWLENEPS
jgi:DNA-directed RNA polymerase beta' subunit